MNTYRIFLPGRGIPLYGIYSTGSYFDLVCHRTACVFFDTLAADHQYRDYGRYFLVVFLVQKSQNKKTMAIQLKLNELIAISHYASNRLIGIGNLSQQELEILRNYYARLNELIKKEKSMHQSHSIEEAERNKAIKKNKQR